MFLSSTLTKVAIFRVVKRPSKSFELWLMGQLQEVFKFETKQTYIELRPSLRCPLLSLSLFQNHAVRNQSNKLVAKSIKLYTSLPLTLLNFVLS